MVLSYFKAPVWIEKWCFVSAENCIDNLIFDDHCIFQTYFFLVTILLSLFYSYFDLMVLYVTMLKETFTFPMISPFSNG